MSFLGLFGLRYLAGLLRVLSGLAALAFCASSFAFTIPGTTYAQNGAGAPLSETSCVTSLVIPEITNAYPATFSGANSTMAFASPAAASVRIGGVLCPGTYTVSYSVQVSAASCGNGNWQINQVTDTTGDNLIAQTGYNGCSSTQTATSSSGAYNTETGGAFSPIQLYTDSDNNMYVDSLTVTFTGVSRLP